MAMMLLHRARHRDHLPLADPDLPGRRARRDILVVAIGRAGFVTPDLVKPGATVIDVGMNRRDRRRGGGASSRPSRRGARRSRGGEASSSATSIPGVSAVAGALTPVPGGVGPLTIALLMKNTLVAAEAAARPRPAMSRA